MKIKYVDKLTICVRCPICLLTGSEMIRTHKWISDNYD